MASLYCNVSAEVDADIKLAFAVSKGKLEVHVISVQGLPLTSSGHEPGT